ncbi:MAG: hypothetical protein COT73_11280 [Bdellovibrio sp. CG10_big_fil_rev_8_21_14_0_10_47_8]|nr:MAG: hypothetical protein COT73_11280 [Bdellovibrio sp. CG10_big_fil_rev_8_21_14_0_10_47_8]
MKIVLGLFTIFLMSNNVFAADPQYLKIKVYKMAVSTSPLCTNLVTIIDNGSSPTYTDVLVNPTLGSGSVADGTYPCVVIEFSDTLQFASDTTTGSCTASTNVSMSVCQNSETSTLIDGSTTTCTAGDDRVAMYLSTASTATTGTGGHSAFQAPTSVGDATKGFLLSTALTVSGSAAGKFVVNGTGKIDGTGGSCDMQPPAFSFSKVQ